LPPLATHAIAVRWALRRAERIRRQIVLSLHVGVATQFAVSEPPNHASLTREKPWCTDSALNWLYINKFVAGNIEPHYRIWESLIGWHLLHRNSDGRLRTKRTLGDAGAANNGNVYVIRREMADDAAMYSGGAAHPTDSISQTAKRPANSLLDGALAGI